MMAAMPGPLSDLRVVEIAGIGPGPFAGDAARRHGRRRAARRPRVRAARRRADRAATSRCAAAPSRGVDLKSADGRELVRCAWRERADALIEGFRPGVMERLGLGPDVLLAAQSRGSSTAA